MKCAAFTRRHTFFACSFGRFVVFYHKVWAETENTFGRKYTMKWKVYTITTTVDAEDYVCAALTELGFDSVEIIDSVPLTKEEEKAQFIDIPPILPENDTTSRIRCYEEISEASDRTEEILSAIREYEDIVDLGELKVETSVTEDLDWINNWKQYFHSFRIGDDIVIKPTWETDADVKKGDLVVEIDPGTAFGTGSHETTWLCIEGLKERVKPDSAVLDVGCGSGILAIIAKKLGASYCVGVDIDPVAVEVSKENAAQNDLLVAIADKPDIFPGAVSFFAGDVISDAAFAAEVTLQRYDVVVANILADIIMPLAPVVKQFLAEDGVFLCSGILNTREAEVRASLERDGYEVIGAKHRNDWVSLAARVRR